MRLRPLIAAMFCLMVPPCWFKNVLLRSLGWQICTSCRIGFSWVRAPKVRLADRAQIGHGNFIETDAVILASGAYVKHFNRATGPFWLVLGASAGIGNQNKITRAKHGVTWARSMLKLGEWSKITSGHIIDCCRSVVMGDYTIVAGTGTQIWTHGYLHRPTGIDRFRIDGRVQIGSNVYIGSACVINAGVKIGDAISIGAASCVSRSLQAPGLYVSQPLRHVSVDYEQAFERHPRVQVVGLIEAVVNKHLGQGP